jgi:hypothetical protein
VPAGLNSEKVHLAEPDVMSNLFSLFNEHWDKELKSA